MPQAPRPAPGVPTYIYDMTEIMHRGYAAPEMDQVEFPLAVALCELSGDLVDIGEEDAGIENWG